MTLAALYLRISDDKDGEGLGVARQEEDCRILAANRGWTVGRVFCDNDVSATRSMRRPAYEDLLAAVGSGEVQAVIVWSLDRLHRRPLELEHFMTLAEARGLELATVTGDHDLSTIEGKLHARILGAVGASESARIGQRVQRKQQQLRDQGHPFSGGKRPFGYDKTRSKVVKSEARIIKECAGRVLDGESLGSISRDLNSRGIPTVTGAQWSRTTIRTMLTRPRIVGDLTYKGQTVGSGSWKPILDRNTWERLQVILKDPDRAKHTRGNKRKHLLSGIATCAVCGSGMGVSLPSSRDRWTGPRYKCRAKSCSTVNEEHLDAFVLAALAEREAARTPPSQLDPTPLLEELQALEAKQRKVAVDFASDPNISGEQVAVASKLLREQVDLVRSRLQEIEKTNMNARLDRVTQAPAEEMAVRFPLLPLEVRRTLIEQRIERVVVAKTTQRGSGFDAERVTIEWKEWGFEG